MLHLNYKPGMTVVTCVVKSVMFGALIVSVLMYVVYHLAVSTSAGEDKWDGHLTLCATSCIVHHPDFGSSKIWLYSFELDL